MRSYGSSAFNWLNVAWQIQSTAAPSHPQHLTQDREEAVRFSDAPDLVGGALDGHGVGLYDEAVVLPAALSRIVTR